MDHQIAELFKNYSGGFQTNHIYKYQENVLITLLDSLKFDSILEIGCSFGRITEILDKRYKPKRFLTIDLADEVKRYQGVDFIQTDIMSLPETEKFDLVIAVEVLMHNRKVQEIIDKMQRMSNKHVVHLDYWSESVREELRLKDNDVTTWNLGNGNFLHDYYGKKLKLSNNQAIFYYYGKD